MSGSVESCTVVRTDDMDPETAVVRYRKRADGWYVQTPKDAEFREFAHPEAAEVDVIQLINKKWDARYGDPDSFEEQERQQATLGGIDG
jgi:predicted DNA-binding WGR domain protein